jgi:hypothetical protein
MKYVAIFLISPFVYLSMLRLMFWAAGAEWSDPQFYVGISMCVSTISSIIICATLMIIENVK